MKKQKKRKRLVFRYAYNMQVALTSMTVIAVMIILRRLNADDIFDKYFDYR